MTRKTAPRAPVCESDTLGGCKDATPGLREEGEGEGEGEGGRAIRNSEGGKKEKDIHTYRPCGDLQVYKKRRVTPCV